jgi:hypothetical protein
MNPSPVKLQFEKAYHPCVLVCERERESERRARGEREEREGEREGERGREREGGREGGRASKEQAFKISNAIAAKVTSMNLSLVKLQFKKVYHPCVMVCEGK